MCPAFLKLQVLPKRNRIGCGGKLGRVTIWEMNLNSSRTGPRRWQKSSFFKYNNCKSVIFHSVYFVVSAACSALDYHGTSRRLFVGLASGTISVSFEFMKILMQSSHFFFTFAICTSSILYLVAPSKCCIRIVINFTWKDCTIQKK